MVTFKAMDLSEEDMDKVRRAKLDMKAKNNRDFLMDLITFYQRGGAMVL